LVGGFKKGVELVNGSYELRLFDPDHDELLYARTFEVSGCSETAPRGCASGMASVVWTVVRVPSVEEADRLHL
jgi:hypothetical protein